MTGYDRISLTIELQAFYAEYCACLDEGRFERWPKFFSADCIYKLISRENFDAGRPLATLSFESRGMLEDRVFGITQTLFHAPYYQRHILSSVLIRSVDGNTIRSEASYLVVRTKRDEPSEVFNTGRYLDVVVREDGAWQFRERLCVFDSDLILTSIIYPI